MKTYYFKRAVLVVFAFLSLMNCTREEEELFQKIPIVSRPKKG